jgi:hypothetical protein
LKAEAGGIARPAIARCGARWLYALQQHAGGHLLDTLVIAAGLFGFLLDVPILALFFVADTALTFLLGYRALLASMEHLFGQSCCHTPATEQNLSQALRHRQPRIGTSPLPPLSLPWRRYSLTLASHNFSCRRNFAIKMRALALKMRAWNGLSGATEAVLLCPYGLALSTY